MVEKPYREEVIKYEPRYTECDRKIDPVREATYRLEGASACVQVGKSLEAAAKLDAVSDWLYRGSRPEHLPELKDDLELLMQDINELRRLVDKPERFEKYVEEREIFPRMIDIFMLEFVKCLCPKSK